MQAFSVRTANSPAPAAISASPTVWSATADEIAKTFPTRPNVVSLSFDTYFFLDPSSHIHNHRLSCLLIDIFSIELKSYRDRGYQ